ncbi:molybdenum cofactor guanylyltransferase MobA [Thermoanaerobacter kivui]|uniref:Probable molybdenum cofactor guanylyltransferase n=1 Tax=Thermoanaerobacter kivui TaxID=2325 RepID=A0A097ATM1_THEKI|nr:molybdenum cofactor guanylyltransferase [Thermoanaerobacter kivui]AIS53144.1 molybdenum cofactor guanylyltransferase MobA [Thermoanaerobacter kivui]
MELFKTAVMLAGGKSKRMGFDKCMLKVQNCFLSEMIIKNLRKVFDDIVVVTWNKEFYQNFNVRVVHDELQGIGPLGGIHAGLKASLSHYAFFIACDMPFISIPYIEYMMELLKKFKKDVIISENRGFIEPFHAFYSKATIDKIEECYKENKLKIADFLKKVDVIKVKEENVRKFSSELEIFINLNNPEDVVRFEAIIKSAEKYNS